MRYPIRSFIISNHRLFIEAICDLVEERSEFAVAGWAANPEDFQDVLIRIRSHSFDVILLDATMTGTDALQVIRNIKREFPEAKLIALGLDHRDQIIVEFIEAGAIGYLLKDASLDELFGTVKAVHSGQSPCSSQVAASIFCRLAQLSRKHRLMQDASQSMLTTREKEILRLMSAGLDNKEISRRLNIALYTVKNHVHNILGKFQVHYRQEAIRYAYENGLLDGPGHLVSSLGRNVYFIGRQGAELRQK